MYLQLLLHNPADMPIGLQPTTHVTGNKMLTVSSSIDTIRTSSKVNNWAPKIRNCYFQNEKTLKFFKIYTIHNCEMECRANNTFSECGCNAYYQPSEII